MENCLKKVNEARVAVTFILKLLMTGEFLVKSYFLKVGTVLWTHFAAGTAVACILV